MSIKFSKKHGLNPSIGVCPICLKENDEILLLGRLSNDSEAPRKTISNVCSECQSKLDKGYYPLVVMKDIKKNTIQGNMVNLKDIEREGHVLFVKKEMLNEVPKTLYSCISESTYKELTKGMDIENPEQG